MRAHVNRIHGRYNAQLSPRRLAPSVELIVRWPRQQPETARSSRRSDRPIRPQFAIKWIVPIGRARRVADERSGYDIPSEKASRARARGIVDIRKIVRCVKFIAAVLRFHKILVKSCAPRASEVDSNFVRAGTSNYNRGARSIRSALTLRESLVLASVERVHLRRKISSLARSFSESRDWRKL